MSCMIELNVVKSESIASGSLTSLTDDVGSFRVRKRRAASARVDRLDEATRGCSLKPRSRTQKAHGESCVQKDARVAL